MPNINVYIRSGDLEKFQALENKSEFIHNALNGLSGSYGEPKSVDWGKAQEFPVSTKPLDKNIKVNKDGTISPKVIGKPVELSTEPQRTAQREPYVDKFGTLEEMGKTIKLCKHGADPKFCKFAKPGKICK